MVSRFQGAIWGASVLPLALYSMLSGGFEMRSAAVMPVLASALMVVGGWMIRVRPSVSKVCLTVSSGIIFFLLLPLLLKAPPSFMMAGALWLWVVLGLWALDCETVGRRSLSTPSDWLERSNGLLGIVAGSFLLLALLKEGGQTIPLWMLGLGTLILPLWGFRGRSGFSGWGLGLAYAFVCLLLYLVIFFGTLSGGWVLVLSVAGIVFIRKALEKDRLGEGVYGGWLDSIVDNPARLLIGSFLLIGIVGAFVLCQPWCSATGVALNPIDALFTSISAVCVTGLVVQDTPGFFSGMGQGVILGLIQIGGLGIMTLTTLAMHLLGQRLSLRQERVMGSLAHAGHSDLIVSLSTVFRFTLWAEIVGSAGLSLMFFKLGEAWPAALWRGVFTSISAFCNAGFALQTDSLVGYAHEPLILHMVGFLIIAGGLAPATCLMIPHWMGGKRIPIAAKLALITTAAFLFLGWIGILVFEWKGVLGNFGFVDKLHHAWFQSVTLRTAGFNSVELASITHPTYLLMLVFMFVGGSPGGTAGGIKTTTVAVLAVAFWTDIMHRSDIVVHNRRITPRTVYRAITIVMSGILLWMGVVFFLEVTQSISARDLVFEATSALGTVGLSTGATGLLDDIGKLTIVFAMFAGRVGPMTLFLLLSRQRVDSVPSCPDARIPLS